MEPRSTTVTTTGRRWVNTVRKAYGLIERVALALVHLAVEAGDYDAARAAIISGLRGVPMSEALYRARMNVEAASGDLHAVKKAYSELTHLLDNMIAGFEPSVDTVLLTN